MTTKTRRLPKAGEGKSLLDLDALAKTLTAATPPVPTSDAPVDTAPETGQEPASSNGTAAMVALFPDPDMAAALAQDGGQDPATLHITLLYLGDDSTNLDRAAVEAAVSNVAAVYGPVTGELNGLCVFNPTGRDEDQGMPLVATLDAPGLSSLREAIANEVREAAQIPPDTHGFCPHMTLAYLPTDGDSAVPGPSTAPPATPITFSDLVVAWPDTQTRIPLTGAFDAAGTGIEEAIEAMPDDATTPDEPEETPVPDAVTPAPAMGLATDAPADAPPTEPIAGADAVPDEGRVIPTPGPLGMWEACLVTEGEATDEVFPMDDEGSVVRGRFIPPGVLTWREPPLPGGFAVSPIGSPADNGHMGAPVACTATEIFRDGNKVMARGPYLDNADGAALKAAVDGGAPIGPSIDLGASDVWEITTDADGTSRQTLIEGSIAGFCVLPYEAQHSTWFRSVPDAETPAPETMPDEVPAVVPIAASGLTACGAGNGGPIHPPAEWFQPPVMDGPTALHVTEEGRVWGHLAGPGCHIGIPGQCVTVAAGTSRDFTEFHHGPEDGQGIVLADGSRLRVGALTLSGGHADLRASATQAKAHYDESRSVVAFLRATWDDKNDLPAIAGAVLPNVPEDKLQILRALGQSGDWREPDGYRAQEVWRTIDGKPTLIAATVVPVEGFPKMRRAIAAAGMIEAEIVDTRLALMADAAQFAVTGAADLPIAPRDTEWDGAGASKRVAKMCTEGDTLDPACFARAFFYRSDSEPDTNVGSYSLPFADVIDGKLQAVYAGVAAGAARLDQTDIPAGDKDQIKGRMNAYYKRFAEAFSDPNIVAPWDKSGSAVVADGLLVELAHDMYRRRLGEEVGVLASAHQREAERLGALVR